MTQAHITNLPNVSDVTVNFGFLDGSKIVFRKNLGRMALPYRAT